MSYVLHAKYLEGEKAEKRLVSSLRLHIFLRYELPLLLLLLFRFCSSLRGLFIFPGFIIYLLSSIISSLFFFVFTDIKLLSLLEPPKPKLWTPKSSPEFPKLKNVHFLTLDSYPLKF